MDEQLVKLQSKPANYTVQWLRIQLRFTVTPRQEYKPLILNRCVSVIYCYYVEEIFASDYLFFT